ncbi:MAG: 2Fe-2S iron-sulfur cluster-binding protein [Anaerolineaceae bacterium]
MYELVNLTIDQKRISVKPGTTILKAAESAWITIPTICYHQACTSYGLCRICVVEVQGSRTLVAACVAAVTEGMVVTTRSERIDRARRTILEMLASTIDLSDSPDIRALMAEYQAVPDRFPEAQRREPPLLDDNPMYIRDYQKCILCWRCVQVCAQDAQYTFAINFTGRGFETSIGTFYDKSMPNTTCVFCGQCVGVCPTGALKPKREWLLENGLNIQQVIAMTRAERSENSFPENSSRTAQEG